MKIIQRLGLPVSKVLTLLAVMVAGAAAPAQDAPPAPGGAPAGPRLLDEGSCTLVRIPMREPLSVRLAPPRVPGVNGASINWSGYAIATRLAAPQKGSVNSVAGSWIVPTVSSSGSAHTYSACWVGMDGNTVEQLGTEQDWTPNGQVNFVWFEMYPHSAFLISGFPITAGDVFGAGVLYLGNSTFRLSITNFTQNTVFTVPTRYTRMVGAQRTSAEWIVEAPYSGGLLPLANFGTVYFAGCTARLNGMQGPIDAPYWQAAAISMETLKGVPKALPSVVSDSGNGSAANSAFAVVWSHE